LLHDDVVDESDLRRGKKTARLIWGNQASVLVGDYLLGQAFKMMVETGSLEALAILSHASSVIAEGEVLQISASNNTATTEDAYLQVIDAKTAALFAAAAEVGAVVANRPQEERAALSSYGRNLGVAFQLVDDALDYSGKQAEIGKTVGDDFREGKMTLPVVYAIARAKPEEKSFWRRVITEGRQEADDFEKALEFMDRDDAIADTIACARRYAERAIAELNKAPENAFSEALSALVTTSVSRAS